LVKLNWTKGLSQGVSYYIAGINKGKFNTFSSDFIAYKVVLDINMLSTLVKLRVLGKGY
jgi:hypothetical protein